MARSKFRTPKSNLNLKTDVHRCSLSNLTKPELICNKNFNVKLLVKPHVSQSNKKPCQPLRCVNTFLRHVSLHPFFFCLPFPLYPVCWCFMFEHIWL